MSPSEKTAAGLRAFVRSLEPLWHVEPRTEGRRDARWLLLLVAATAAIWFALAANLAPYISDDSIILLRHVRHYLEGYGAVWDPTLPVEAHSSPLWVFLLALVSKLGVDLLTSGVLLGIIASACAMATLFAVTRGLGPLWLRLSFVTLVATNPPVTTWTNAGLEMPLALFVVIAFVASVGRLWQEPDAWAHAALAACCLSSSAIRPDLPLQLAACSIALCMFPGAPRRSLLVGIALLVAGWLGLALWRLEVYGDYVALPQRAKSVFEPVNLLRYGRYVLNHSPLLVLVAGLVAGAWLWRPRRPRPVELSAILLAGAIMSEHALLGGDELSRGRFTVQPLALLVIPLVRPLASLAMPARRVAIALGAVVVVHVVFALRPLPDGDHLCGDAREEVGRWIESHTTPDFSIASTSAGYVPYYAERPATDLMGLTHPDMARLDVTRGTPEYGFEVARIAARDRICGLIVPVCGSLPEATCPLPPQAHKLMSGVRRYLHSSDAYQAARVELPSGRHLIIYVHESCRDRIRGVQSCDEDSTSGC